MINSEKWAFSVNDPSVIKILGSACEINELIQKILKSLQSININKTTLFDIRLCLEEAFVNALKHGNKNNAGLPVNIEYSISEEEFKISIKDSGAGFNYRKIPDPTVNKNLLKTKGRGVYLIRYLMDEVSYNKTGNKITMVKYLGGNHADKPGKK